MQDLPANDNLDSASTEGALTLQHAISVSLQNDLTLQRTEINVNRFSADIASQSSLPDPIFFASLQGLPTDTLKLNQEAMTQLRVGFKQLFPKGDSVDLSKKIVQHNIYTEKSLHHLRALTLKHHVESTWLEAWYWQANKSIVEHDRTFLTQMLAFNRSMYQLGAKNQSDLIGAELELIKLDEKLIEADRQYAQFRRALYGLANQTFTQKILHKRLPILILTNITSKEEFFKRLNDHPEIQRINYRIDQLSDQAALVEQDQKPQWGVEVGYGLRQGDNRDGSSRSDLLSAGLSVTLPLFSGSNKQESIKSIRYQKASVENRRLERLNEIYFEFENLYLQYKNTVSQRSLYESKILPTLLKQKNSALKSYQADKGDFRVVTELYLKEQSTRLKKLRLDVQEQLLISKMNFWSDHASIQPFLTNANVLARESIK